LADNGDPFWVYSQDIKTNQLKPAQAIRPRFTGYRDDLVEVVLDNGYSFKCTEDHLILLRHNVYCKAGDLNINDCLMPMYYNFTYNNKYESIYNTYRETPYESYRNPPI
jgi:intein/homing endonuclease